MRTLRVAALVVSLALLAACSENAKAPAGGKPTPALYRFGLTRTGQSPFQGPDKPMIKWKVATGGPVHSSPVLDSKGNIYIGSDDGHLYSITPSGQIRWKVATGNAIRSTPAVGPDGTVYVGALDGNLYAVTPQGSIKWKSRLGEELMGVNSSPAVTDEAIYVLSTEKNLIAVDPDDGDELWEVRTWGPPKFIEGEEDEEPGVSSPAVGPDGSVYVGSFGKRFLALDRHGQLKWELPIESMAATPAVGPDGTIYVATLEDRTLRAVSPAGKETWRFTADDLLTASPAVASDGTVYVASARGTVYALGQGGQVKWSLSLGMPVVASPIVDARGTLYVVAFDGVLRAIAPDGKERWQLQLGGQIASTPVIGPDGTLYLGSPDKHVYAIGEAR